MEEKLADKAGVEIRRGRALVPAGGARKGVRVARGAEKVAAGGRSLRPGPRERYFGGGAGKVTNGGLGSLSGGR